MPIRETNADTDPSALALNALVWVISDGSRADRLLTLTGLDVATLRAQAGAPATLAAVLGFLEAYEPDLVECAAALGVRPTALTEARRALENA